MNKRKLSLMIVSMFTILFALIIPLTIGFDFKTTVGELGSSTSILKGWGSGSGETLKDISTDREGFKFLGYSVLATSLYEITLCIFIFGLGLAAISLISFLLSGTNFFLFKIFDLANIVLAVTIFLLTILLTVGLTNYANTSNDLAQIIEESSSIKLAGKSIFSIIAYWGFSISLVALSVVAVRNKK